MSISDRIERVARVIAEHVGFLDDLDSDPQSVQDVYLHPVALARALDQAGLLAPAPLAEVQADAWDECVREGEACGYIGAHDATELEARNPYREPVDRAEGDGSAER